MEYVLLFLPWMFVIALAQPQPLSLAIDNTSRGVYYLWSCVARSALQRSAYNLKTISTCVKRVRETFLLAEEIA